VASLVFDREVEDERVSVEAKEREPERASASCPAAAAQLTQHFPSRPLRYDSQSPSVSTYGDDSSVRPSMR